MKLTKRTSACSSDVAAREGKHVIQHSRRGERQRPFQHICLGLLGFFLVTALVVGAAALNAEYIIIRGPSPALKDAFVGTLMETRRLKFIPGIMMSEAELKPYAIKKTPPKPGPDDEKDLQGDGTNQSGEQQTNDSKTGNEIDLTGESLFAPLDEDGDGIVLQPVKGAGFTGYAMIVLDPTRVFVGMPDKFGGEGLTLEDMCKKYGAVGGINAGGFRDEGGRGCGGMPEGLTMIDGVCYNDAAYEVNGLAGLTEEGILHAGWYTLEDCKACGITDAASFGPTLIENGEPACEEYLTSGINPRTAIGQTKNGEIILLVIDGRQVQSIGASYNDVVSVLLDYGCVTACNMDGGSSTSMYLNGEYVNSCSAENGKARPLPTAFLVRALE